MSLCKNLLHIKNQGDSENAALLQTAGTLKTERNAIPKPWETSLRFSAWFHNNICDIEDNDKAAQP